MKIKYLFKKIFAYLDDFYCWNRYGWMKYIIEDKFGRIRLSPRWFSAVWFRLKNGFDKGETWSLQYTIAKFIFPRLKYFREMDKIGVPNDLYEKYKDKNKKHHDNIEITSKEWDKLLDKMVYAFERVLIEDDDNHSWQDKAYWEKQQKLKKEGLKLFAEYFENLWD